MLWSKTPSFLQQLFPETIWKIKTQAKEVYLTFDDGPHPETTQFILEQLHQFNFSATFFCTGKSVKENVNLFQQLKDNKQGIGHHSYHHFNGWTTATSNYLKDVEAANSIINSTLFRPPYGKLRPQQLKKLKQKYKVVMWNVMPEDYNQNIGSEVVFQRLVKNIQPGNIIVLHENNKSKNHIKKILPRYFELLQSKGFQAKKLPIC